MAVDVLDELLEVGPVTFDQAFILVNLNTPTMPEDKYNTFFAAMYAEILKHDITPVCLVRAVEGIKGLGHRGWVTQKVVGCGADLRACLDGVKREENVPASEEKS